MDTELMRRIANDSASTSFQANRGLGSDIYALSSAQLQAAFAQVAWALPIRAELIKRSARRQHHQLLGPCRADTQP